MRKLLLLLLLTTSYINAQYFENFDAYNLGNMADQNPARWTNWGGGNTAGDLIIIDDSQFFSSGQSGLVGINGGDAFFLLGNKTSGTWSVHFKMYVPSEHSAGFEIMGETTSSDGFIGEFITYNISFNNNNDNPGIGNFSGTSFTFPHDSWFDVILVIDVSNTNFQITIDGNLVTPTPHDFIGGNILGAINFFHGNVNNTYWIDDINFFEGALSINTYIKKGIDLYPNPTSGILYVENNENITTNKITILNTLGEKVFVNKNIDTINISNLPSGIYYINIENIKGDKVSYKIIKK